jgi:hypothetical protein
MGKGKEIATVGQDVPQVIELLEAKLKTMDDVRESKYITNGVLDKHDIKTETKIEELIKCFASVLAREEIYNKSAEVLGIETYPTFDICGGNVEHWKHDIQLRIKVINQKDTVEKLEYFKSKMSEFLSKEDQKNMLMKEMESFLKNV